MRPPFRQIEKPHDGHIDFVKFCRFSQKMRKICQKAIHEGAPLMEPVKRPRIFFSR